MKPWHKRLADLRQLIIQADGSYFEPDLFRLNVNNAIQTARTVTFLIQKGKSSIPDFDDWYKSNALDPTANDPIMRWLVDARNKIEKEGDLATFSECRVELLYSYTERGASIDLPNEKLLFAGIKKLIRHATRTLPTGIAKAASILVERRWVATSYPSMELTDILEYGYSRLRHIVQKLDEHIGDSVNIRAAQRHAYKGSGSRRMYVKVCDGRSYSMTSEKHKVSLSHPPEGFDLDKLRGAYAPGATLQQRVEAFSHIACDLFDRDGYHITMLVTLDAEGNPSGNRNIQFDDQADKINFWHSLAREAEADPYLCGVIFISEYWNRDVKGFPVTPISDLPIVGEGLKIVAADASGAILGMQLDIVETESGKRVHRNGQIESLQIENYLVPILNVWKRRRTP